MGDGIGGEEEGGRGRKTHPSAKTQTPPPPPKVKPGGGGRFDVPKTPQGGSGHPAQGRGEDKKSENEREGTRIGSPHPGPLPADWEREEEPPK